MQHLDYLLIPLSAGIVGFVTNALAVRMLFRPYKPRWYSLGWQGIIPRTRKALAANISRVVGDRLVTAEEIDATIKEAQVQQRLLAEVSAALNSDMLWKYAGGFVNESMPQILSDAAVSRQMDALSGSFLSYLIDYAEKAKVEAILNRLGGLKAQGLQLHLESFFRRAIISYVHSFVASGKSLYDLTGTINTAEIARVIALSIQASFPDLFSSPGMVHAISEGLIRYKNEQFDRSKTDKMKLGMLNIFFSDSKIKELVHEKLPGIGQQMSDDRNLLVQLNVFIVCKLDELISTPLRELVANIDSAKYQASLNKIAYKLAAKLAPAELFSYLSEAILKNIDADATLGQVLEKEGISLKALLPATLPLSAMLESEAAKRLAFDGLASLRGWLFEEEHRDKAAELMVKQGTALLEKALPAFLSIINISGLVEKKVNSLEMQQVEDLLFTFMRSHFKWINLLGFIIGFFVGLGQLIIVHF